jgi:hypothetical protein
MCVSVCVVCVYVRLLGTILHMGGLGCHTCDRLRITMFLGARTCRLLRYSRFQGVRVRLGEWMTDRSLCTDWTTHRTLCTTFTHISFCNKEVNEAAHDNPGGMRVHIN